MGPSVIEGAKVTIFRDISQLSNWDSDDVNQRLFLSFSLKYSFFLLDKPAASEYYQGLLQTWKCCLIRISAVFFWHIKHIRTNRQLQRMLLPECQTGNAPRGTYANNQQGKPRVSLLL